jgi:hypothetical protein
MALNALRRSSPQRQLFQPKLRQLPRGRHISRRRRLGNLHDHFSEVAPATYHSTMVLVRRLVLASMDIFLDELILWALQAREQPPIDDSPRFIAATHIHPQLVITGATLLALLLARTAAWPVLRTIWQRRHE